MENIRLSKNIRSLRKAYGESQEDLGCVLEIGKTAIYNYEKGIRRKNNSIYQIAKHFLVPIDELVYGDLSQVKKLSCDYSIVWKKIDDIFPKVNSKKAEENIHFRRAIKNHDNLYKELKMQNMDGIYYIEKCLKEYSKALEDEVSKIEASANLLGVWNLFFLIFLCPIFIEECRTSALLQMASKDPKVKVALDEIELDDLKEAKAILKELNGHEEKKQFNELLKNVKYSNNYSDLADYYLALKYAFNLVDNNLGWELNLRIAGEMMNSFESVGNVYVQQFFKVFTN